MLSKSQIVRLENQHHTLFDLVKGHPEEVWRRKPIPGKWSVVEQVAHLAAYQPVFYGRLQKMAKDENPSFERYLADNDPHFHECCTKPLSWLLDYTGNVRSSINEYLQTLTETGLQRTGLHPKYGKMTITAWTEFFLLHEAHHLFSIFMLARDMNIDA